MESCTSDVGSQEYQKIGRVTMDFYLFEPPSDVRLVVEQT